MLHSNHRLQISPLDQSVYSPWEITQPDEEENHFLPPSLAISNVHQQDHSCFFFAQHQSCQLEAPNMKRHISTRSTIHSPRPHQRRETGSQTAKKPHRRHEYREKNLRGQKKKIMIRQSKSLNEPNDSVFFTNNVICFKLNPQAKRQRQKVDSNRNKSRQNHTCYDNEQGRLKNEGYFPRPNANKIIFQRKATEIKIKQYSKLFDRQGQRGYECENFAIKRNMLRIGKSRKLAQML